MPLRWGSSHRRRAPGTPSSTQTGLVRTSGSDGTDWRGLDADPTGLRFRWVTVGAPGQNVDIVLFQPHGGRSQVEGDALLSLVTQGSLQAAIFRTDDLEATFEKVRASDAEVLQEPASQPWGARDCAFRDPSGNLVRIAQA
ncbi:MAG: VOC family protein [Acidimicrobiales bacterium]